MIKSCSQDSSPSLFANRDRLPEFAVAAAAATSSASTKLYSFLNSEVDELGGVVVLLIRRLSALGLRAGDDWKAEARLVKVSQSIRQTDKLFQRAMRSPRVGVKTCDEFPSPTLRSLARSFARRSRVQGCWVIVSSQPAATVGVERWSLGPSHTCCSRSRSRSRRSISRARRVSASPWLSLARSHLCISCRLWPRHAPSPPPLPSMSMTKWACRSVRFLFATELLLLLGVARTR